jgi:hypothetical protein
VPDYLGVGFLDELTAPEPPKSRCSIAAIKERLADDEVRGLDEAMKGNLPASTLAERLTRLGYQISASSVLRHRKRQCRCA